ncbi:metallo-beta-lactamase superfamily protein [Isoptericola sp. CG 20/1183]|uniref:Metallo-beta-lactamase superfamily protein n=1 Tax=Isoptericola halotolerans TaxID=300560 RepID=A0ABX5EGD2_9MICO|nr:MULTISPECIES: MBL fold metallo-hydrolase [Isoptericola]PRZ08554.1 metallo-beta-lactamase superfamily protein [Isoptericola halotolerans]PRZ10999.1 metallo-beta-lactamase superfamily protein [Isoptericola sp. CG 20/1183]
MTSFWICRTCAVEHATRPEVCAICADERQWVPASGQSWTTLDELAAEGRHIEVEELEPDLFGLQTTPGVGIGQQAKLLRTPAGSLLWDPLGFVDDDGAAAVRDLAGIAGVVAVAASHPHMFGVQVEWSRRLAGDAGPVPVLVAEADAGWVARPDDSIVPWSGEREVLPGVTLSQPGGHFPGSAVVHWAAGAGGRGVLLSGDTIFANPDRTASFLRSYPNRIPLSGAVALRVAGHVARRPFDRMYNNFDGVIPADARAVVLRSARRHAAWVRGDFDHLT